VAVRFFDALVRETRRLELLSDEHFSVDGMLLEAWASMRSYRRKDGGSVELAQTAAAQRTWLIERGVQSMTLGRRFQIASSFKSTAERCLSRSHRPLPA
jgi:hypothetical protein